VLTTSYLDHKAVRRSETHIFVSPANTWSRKVLWLFGLDSFDFQWIFACYSWRVTYHAASIHALGAWVACCSQITHGLLVVCCPSYSCSTCRFVVIELSTQNARSRNIKSATGTSGLTATAQGGGADQTQAPRWSLRVHITPPFFKSIWCCCSMSFLSSSKSQGSQTYKNHLVVRTPLYRHTTLIALEFSPNKSQRRNCTAALQHLEVWPPSKGLRLPSESPPAGSRGRGSLRLA
jgi:hypothetical protein